MANGFNGFSRFCSSQFVPANQFGSRGVGENIYFTGEEDGGFFNGVGGAVWALDPVTRRFFQVPAMGRGAWENITQIDTGKSDTVAFILADDTSPFDFDGDGENEAAPLFLYVGTKDPDGKLPNGQSDFLARNGLRTGKLYVWVATSGVKLPSEFNGKGSSQAGKWVEIDNAPTGTPSEDGSTGFDPAGYPTQGTLWLRAKAVGSFGFSRPEDVATNPADGTEIVLASTGVDTYDIDPETGNGADTFGTLYKIKTQFPDPNDPALSDFHSPVGQVSILYDGDEDKSRLLRSPDNLEWSADGFIYVQEDEAEEDTASGDEVLFGPGAANPREAGIVRLRADGRGSISRLANINRNVVLDPSTAGKPVDKDAGAAGEWESSGIIDVSTLFGKAAGTLFLTTVQAHGIEDQTDFNADSRINDNDLVEGGQLLFIEKK